MPAEREKATVRFERRYRAKLQDLWELWTTREGFESWWGPVGCRVEVKKLDLRVGGEFVYDMIVHGEDEVAALEAEGIALRHPTRGVFSEVVVPTRLRTVYTIDFVPGFEPYENSMLLELSAKGDEVLVVVTIDAHPGDEWTERSKKGFESQLTKLPAAIAARSASR